MKRRKPFSAARTREVICKVILFYSVFFVVMKIIRVLFEDGLPLPNLILCIPFLILSYIGFRFTQVDKYSWFYVAIGIIFISAIRYFNSGGEIIRWLALNL